MSLPELRVCERALRPRRSVDVTWRRIPARERAEGEAVDWATVDDGIPAERIVRRPRRWIICAAELSRFKYAMVPRARSRHGQTTRRIAPSDTPEMVFGWRTAPHHGACVDRERSAATPLNALESSRPRAFSRPGSHPRLWHASIAATCVRRSASVHPAQHQRGVLQARNVKSGNQPLRVESVRDRLGCRASRTRLMPWKYPDVTGSDHPVGPARRRFVRTLLAAAMQRRLGNVEPGRCRRPWRERPNSPRVWEKSGTGSAFRIGVVADGSWRRRSP
jgi:hypothetical protein